LGNGKEANISGSYEGDEERSSSKGKQSYAKKASEGGSSSGDARNSQGGSYLVASDS
jgi:hypothetical protein